MLALVLILVLVRVFLPQTFLSASLPFLHASNYVSDRVGSITAGFENARRLEGARAALATQNEQLAEENAVLLAQNNDLTALEHVPAASPGVAAGVLARPPESPYDTLVVAAGAAAGLEEGDVAYAASGIPLGVVERVSASAASITLLSASGMKNDAWLGALRAPITLFGTGGGTFIAEAPKNASTTIGTIVYIAGPGALPIGTVSGVSVDPAAPFITLAIKGSVNPLSITYVVIRPGASAHWPLTASSTP